MSGHGIRDASLTQYLPCVLLTAGALSDFAIPCMTLSVYLAWSAPHCFEHAWWYLTFHQTTKVNHPIGCHDCIGPLLECCSSDGEISTKTLTPQTQSALEGFRMFVRPVNDRSHHTFPVVHEPESLRFMAHQGLSRAFVSDDVPASLQRCESSRVQHLVLAVVVAVAEDDFSPGPRWH